MQIMQGIFTHSWIIVMVNVGKYTIDGLIGKRFEALFKDCQNNHSQGDDSNNLNNPYKWPYKWVCRGLFTHISGVITLVINGRGPPCKWCGKNVVSFPFRNPLLKEIRLPVDNVEFLQNLWNKRLHTFPAEILESRMKLVERWFPSLLVASTLDPPTWEGERLVLGALPRAWSSYLHQFSGQHQNLRMVETRIFIPWLSHAKAQCLSYTLKVFLLHPEGSMYGISTYIYHKL